MRTFFGFVGLLISMTTVASAQSTWIVDDDALNDPGPGDTSVSDPLEDGSAAHPFDSVQEAINVSINGDTVLVRDGTYTGTGNLQLNPGGRAITIQSENGPDFCTFTAMNNTIPFATLNSGETTATVFDGLHVTFTAGFRVSNGSGLTLRNSFMNVNRGIWGENVGELVVEDSKLNCYEDTSLDFQGAAIHWYTGGAITISNCRFTGNNSFEGGAIFVLGCPSVSIGNCRFTDNDARVNGGAVFIIADDVRIRDSYFFLGGVGGKMGENRGGALYVDSSDAFIVNCQFLDNHAKNGGGIYARGMTKVQNCLFAGNAPSAFDFTASAGAIRGEHLVISQCTFVNNSRENQSAIGALSIAMRNCVIWEEYLTSNSGNNIAYCDVVGGWPGTGNIDVDPQFVDADGPDNNPNTYGDNDYRLAPSSYCIDAGDNDAVPADTLDLDGDSNTLEPLPIDLDGNPRFTDVRCVIDSGVGTAPVVDMGAFEVADFAGGDCNGNMIDDCDDIASGTSQDCNHNFIPDECDFSSGTSHDCNGNGIPDECDINAGTSQDCNGNGIPDDCDINLGISSDCDADGVPDDCTLTAPLSGFALQFNGFGFVDVPSAPELRFVAGEQITLEAWIRPTSVTGNRMIISKNQADVLCYFLKVKDGSLAFGYRDVANTITFTYSTGPVIVTNQWQHVAVAHTFGGGAVTIYLNGMPVAGTWDTTPTVGPRNPGQPLRIGGAQSPTGTLTQVFAGLIDEARLWRTERTQSDIQDFMTSLLTGSETGLTAYWRMDEGSGIVVADSAGSNQGAINNIVPWVGLHHCPCPGDLNGDGQIDLVDLSRLLAAYATTGAGDIDGDEDTDIEDLSILLSVFGQTCP